MKNVSTSGHMNNHRMDFSTNTFFLIIDSLTYNICDFMNLPTKRYLDKRSEEV